MTVGESLKSQPFPKSKPYSPLNVLIFTGLETPFIFCEAFPLIACGISRRGYPNLTFFTVIPLPKF